MAEFELIDRYFRSIASKRDDVAIGIGDDAAVLEVPDGCRLAMSTDTLVAGVHFPQLTAAEDIGYKALAVNLSDLAAMGATPAWVALNLTLPDEDADWLSRFSRGFSELLQRYNIQLIGGDTTHGPLSITVTATGFLPKDRALRRDGARPGDLVYVSGTIGDAGLGLKKILASIDHRASLQHCVLRLNRPTPRVDLGKMLIGISECAIDISDGLLADLTHISHQSQCAAVIELNRVPMSSELQHYYGEQVDWQQILSAGDDYELCFTVSPEQVGELDEMARQLSTRLSCIGRMESGAGVRCLLPDGSSLQTTHVGYDHFDK